MRENLMRQSAPHVRQSESVLTMMTDVIIALIPLYLMSFFYYGIRAIVLGAFSVFCCAVCSALSTLIVGNKVNFRDLTPVITGLIIPLLMPADIPFYVVSAAAAIAILVVKFPFGGTGNNLFNPAAVGYAAVAICWPDVVFKYPAVLQNISVFGENSALSATSPAASLAIGAVPEYDLLDMLLGNVPGQMGTTHILVIIACGIYLIVRKAVNWRAPVFFISTCALFSLAFPRIGGSTFDAVCYELFSGMLIFGAFFMLPEPVTSPKRDFGKLLYSVVSGIVVVLFRYFGGLENGFAYALIVMNVFSPLFDKLCESFLHIYRHKDQLIAAYKNKKEPSAVGSGRVSAPVVRPLVKNESISEISALPEEEPLTVCETSAEAVSIEKEAPVLETEKIVEEEISFEEIEEISAEDDTITKEEEEVH